MRTRIAGLLGVVLTTVLCMQQVQASDASEALLNVPIPATAKVTVIGLDMRQNGALMSISTFRSEASIENTLEFYRAAWPARENDPGHVENTAGNWQVISRLDGDVNLVLQLQQSARGGCEGLFSAVQLNDIVGVAEAIDMPPGGEVVSSTVKADLGRTAKTWIIRSTSGVGHAVSFYRDLFDRKGWKLVSDRSATGPHVLQFNHRDGTVELVISQADDGSTLSILNRVSKDG